MAATPGRKVAFRLDFTPPVVGGAPAAVVVAAVIPSKAAPADIVPAGPIVLGAAAGTASVDVKLPVIDPVTTHLILAGHAVVTPFNHPALADGDALLDPANAFPKKKYDLSKILDGRGGNPLTYPVVGIPAGPFSLGFVQDNDVAPAPVVAAVVASNAPPAV